MVFKNRPNYKIRHFVHSKMCQNIVDVCPSKFQINHYVATPALLSRLH